VNKPGKPAIVSSLSDEAGEGTRSEVSAVFPQATMAPAAPAPAVDASVAIAARLKAAYPARAVDIEKGFIAHGDVITSAVPVKIPGGWGQKVVSRHQKYRLVDGTILTLGA
jgi:hypothetical protein